jgi:hypothetical protein
MKGRTQCRPPLDYVEGPMQSERYSCHPIPSRRLRREEEEGIESKGDLLGEGSMSNAVLFPVVILSPVVPFPNCPFSALPNVKTGRELTERARQETMKRTHAPFPLSVNTTEKLTPAEAIAVFSLFPW